MIIMRHVKTVAVNFVIYYIKRSGYFPFLFAYRDIVQKSRRIVLKNRQIDKNGKITKKTHIAYLQSRDDVVNYKHRKSVGIEVVALCAQDWIFDVSDSLF